MRCIGNVLIKTAVGYILKTEQPISYIRHDHLPLIVYNFPLCVRTISEKTHYVFVLGLHQALNLFVEFLLLHIKCRG